MEIVPHGLKQTVGNATTLTQNDAEQTFALDLSKNPDAQARSLRIEASPSIAATLFGALDYLTSFRTAVPNKRCPASCRTSSSRRL